MRTTTQSKIRGYFTLANAAVFWPSDLSKMLADNRMEWGAFELSTQQFIKFLLKENLLIKAEFTSSKYRPIIRYLCGKSSPYELAVSLRRDSFLSHETALVLHGLEQLTNRSIHVNQEQRSKQAPEGITQEGINRAFKNEQRKSSYIFRNEGSQFVLISGKNTGKAGVIPVKTPGGATVDATDLERTLIDIVVRPAYAGGIKRVFSAYKRAVSRIDVHHMIGLVRELDYAYPYHQSIGFLLERAGRPKRDCEKLREFGLEFDFFLDYRLKRPAYDRNWRLYYPSELA